MQATIQYYLSPAGQKASILAGGDGKADQVLAVPSDHPDFAAVVHAGEVTRDGEVVLDLWAGDYDLPEALRLVRFDAVPSVSDLLAVPAARAAAKEKIKTERAAEAAAKTRAVLDERRTRGTTEYFGGEQWETLRPDWPHDADKAITDGAEAVEWVATLNAANEAARAAAKEKAAAKVEADRLAAEAAAKVEADRRAALGLEEGDLDLAVEAGALTEVPAGCWQSHKRGKNWMAVITPDPTAPGGLSRDFAQKAHGSSFYMVPTLTVGGAIEFGADYLSGSGRRSRTRWYGFVVRQAPEMLVLRECGTGKAACKAGAKYVCVSGDDW